MGNTFKMIAKTLAGMENVLGKELEGLGGTDVKVLRRAVEYHGDTNLLYKFNLNSRYAISILKPILDFNFTDQQEFYDKMRGFAWDDFFTVEKSIALAAVASNSVFTNTHFVAQRAKDAIVDYFRDKVNARPNVDLENPQIKITIFINRDFCSVSLDSSGIPLFKRGYRKNPGVAPLSEVLAAGLIALSGWDKESPFYDPMCGSGTFSIEAALLARNIAPGSFRNKYSFQNWQDYDPEMWDKLREEAKSSATNAPLTIFASDISNSTMVAARQNLMEAGLLGQVRLEKKDFFAATPYHQKGVVFLNPPYGRRLADDNVADIYHKIGSVLKHKFAGFDAWIISPDKTFTHRIGLRAAAKHNIFNGQLDCQFLGYKLYDGSKKRVISTEGTL